MSDAEEDSLYVVGCGEPSKGSSRSPSFGKSPDEYGQYSNRALIDETPNDADAGREADEDSFRSDHSLGGGFSTSGKSEIFEDTPKSAPVAPKKPVRFSDWDD